MKFIEAIKWPIICIATISLPLQLADTPRAQEIEDLIFNLLRSLCVLWAGWLIISTKIGGLWSSALAGALLFLVSHVAIKGGLFLLQGEVLASLGVLVSYLMFFWIPVILGTAGGIASRIYHGKDT